jgi:arginyl-tRNA synthetase
MSDLQQQIEVQVRGAIAAAFGEAHRAVDPLVRPAAEVKFGDYQCNVAMSLAKTLKQKPRDVADAIVAGLSGAGAAGVFAKIEIAGPGFINLTLDEALVAALAAAMLQDQRLGVEPAAIVRKVVVDYSSPNVAKEMHVGHLRSTILGDAIARVLEFCGHAVIRQNHLGDWGTQFGMLIEHLLETADRGQLQRGELAIGDLNAFYQQAKVKDDADPDFAKRARARVVALQSGDPQTLALWKTLFATSMVHFEQAYSLLGVSLTPADVRGESFYNDKLPGVIADLQEAGLLKESQGAAVVYPEGFADRDGNPMPMIVRKSDGGYLYATTDLAAARFRMTELHADRVIYVTDARQAQHFAMVFAVLRNPALQWSSPGSSPEIRLDHVPFGTVLGPDRRPFKTRTGGTIRLSDLLEEAVRRAAAVVAEKNPELSENQREEIARVIGVGAVKYADLSNERIKDYVFDWDRMLAFEGNTAPYLQNAYVRIRSIFRKAPPEMVRAADAALTMTLTEPSERGLALKLLQFPQAVAGVAESLEPHRLCNYLYELASVYHGFYEQCPVLGADDQAVRLSRLRLSRLVARTLRQGLELLGIGVVEQM